LLSLSRLILRPQHLREARCRRGASASLLCLRDPIIGRRGPRVPAKEGGPGRACERYRPRLSVDVLARRLISAIAVQSEARPSASSPCPRKRRLTAYPSYSHFHPDSHRRNSSRSHPTCQICSSFLHVLHHFPDPPPLRVQQTRTAASRSLPARWAAIAHRPNPANSHIDPSAPGPFPSLVQEKA